MYSFTTLWSGFSSQGFRLYRDFIGGGDGVGVVFVFCSACMFQDFLLGQTWNAHESVVAPPPSVGFYRVVRQNIKKVHRIVSRCFITTLLTFFSFYIFYFKDYVRVLQHETLRSPPPNPSGLFFPLNLQPMIDGQGRYWRGSYCKEGRRNDGRIRGLPTKQELLLQEILVCFFFFLRAFLWVLYRILYALDGRGHEGVLCCHAFAPISRIRYGLGFERLGREELLAVPTCSVCAYVCCFFLKLVWVW